MSYFDPERAAWLANSILPHEPALRRWLYSRRRFSMDVDDIVQESYAVLSALQTVAHIVNPKAYLFQTANSLILREVRRAKVVSIEAVEDLDAFGAADELSPERYASDRQDLRFLCETLDTLPGRCQQAFKLRKVEGLSQKQIAERMGLSEKAVEKQVARAMRALMDAFGRGGKYAPRASMLSNGRSQEARGHKRN